MARAYYRDGGSSPTFLFCKYATGRRVCRRGAARPPLRGVLMRDCVGPARVVVRHIEHRSWCHDHMDCHGRVSVTCLWKERLAINASFAHCMQQNAACLSLQPVSEWSEYARSAHAFYTYARNRETKHQQAQSCHGCRSRTHESIAEADACWLCETM